MKKASRMICLIIVLSFVLAMPAYAESTLETTVEPRGSAFFSSYGHALEKVSSTTFKIWFCVNSNAALMQEIGVSSIEVYRSPDRQTWSLMKTFTKEAYSKMIVKNTYSYANFMTYNLATPGYYYTAYITFYAKNASGIGERMVYTEIIKM